VIAAFDALVERLRATLPLAPDKPEETAESTAAALWHAAAGAPVPVTRAKPPTADLDATGVARLEQLVSRRLGGELLGYIVGRQEFMGLEYHVGPGALIPRRETELLGMDAAEVLASILERVPRPNVLDLCTGAGNIAVALAVRCPAARIWATDLEADALRLAADNVRLHDVGDRVQLYQGDLFGALANAGAPKFDLISCNPPYLTTKHATHMPQEIGGGEPTAAFDGGPFGISITLRLIREAPDYLVSGGWLCFELGAGQGEMLEKRIRSNDRYVHCAARTDANGTIRALQARVA